MLRSKIVTDASVLITFNIAVMLNLNDRVSYALPMPRLPDACRLAKMKGVAV